MNNCGNFLELAASKCGVDVGFGKMILVYPQKTIVYTADLTAENINDSIIAGDIIGIIKGWHTVAGAPVAEINVERTGTAEMKLIRPEVVADTLTFESSISNNEIILDLVKSGTLNCILLDDQGSAFGDYAVEAGAISTMALNFSAKATSAFQGDNATEKTTAVTVRYLVKDLSVLLAGIETELIDGKSLLAGQFSAMGSMSSTAADFDLLITDKSTGKIPEFDLTAISVNIRGIDATVDHPTFTIATGILNVSLTSTAMPTVPTPVFVTISGDNFYMKEIKVELPFSA